LELKDMDSLGTTHIGGEVVVIPTKAGWPSLIFHKEREVCITMFIKSDYEKLWSDLRDELFIKSEELDEAHRFEESKAILQVIEKMDKMVDRQP
jgi:hypothetical protein